MKNLRNLMIISILVVALGTLFIMCTPSAGNVCEHIKETVSTSDWFEVFGGMDQCKKDVAEIKEEHKKCIMNAGSYEAILKCTAE